jgi:hypothetical protein
MVVWSGKILILKMDAGGAFREKVQTKTKKLVWEIGGI